MYMYTYNCSVLSYNVIRLPLETMLVMDRLDHANSPCSRRNVIVSMLANVRNSCYPLSLSA